MPPFVLSSLAVTAASVLLSIGEEKPAAWPLIGYPLVSCKRVVFSEKGKKQESEKAESAVFHAC
ncbi:MAG TPA: hypothetical protein DCP92_23195 [Nitrospiraceae bacterium]|jgi:hypothetical protein|nr:hypothetical protein [Nitrospiraceae bacterium]